MTKRTFINRYGLLIYFIAGVIIYLIARVIIALLWVSEQQ